MTSSGDIANDAAAAGKALLSESDQQKQQQELLLQKQQKQQIIKFVPFTSTVDLPFWVRYCHLKLETIRLKEDPIDVVGSYGSSPPPPPPSSSSSAAAIISSCTTNRLQLQESSLLFPPRTAREERNGDEETENDNLEDSNEVVVSYNSDRVEYPGTLIGYNTKEAFQKVNKNNLLKEIFCEQFFAQSDDNDINNNEKNNDDNNDSSSSLKALQMMPSFVLITFADLKNHKVLYWFGFPTLKTETPIAATIINGPCSSTSSSSPSMSLSSSQQKDDYDDDDQTIEEIRWWTALAEGLYHHRFEFEQHEQEQHQHQQKGGSSSNAKTIPAYFAVPSSTISSSSSNSAAATTSRLQVAAPLNTNYRQSLNLDDDQIDEHNKKNDDDDDGYRNDVVFGFVDPTTATTVKSATTSADVSSSDDILTMGWPMRNLIAYLVFHLNLEGKTVQILSLRHGGCPTLSRGGASSSSSISPIIITQSDIDNLMRDSVLMEIKLPSRDDYDHNTDTCNTTKTDAAVVVTAPEYKVVGWELNVKKRAGPRLVNLRPLLDRNHLAIQAADLNLKLMKWRMIPELDVNMLQNSCKVLILGSGTLGCSVSRTLLGWGVRNFTFVDYGNVSYSNPVRQILFNLDDCHDDHNSSSSSSKSGSKKSATGGGGGKRKAIAASDALKRIAADVVSEGVQLSIPMPGHVFDEQQGGDGTTLRETVDRLDELIRQSDVVFLLTDTRESRWLPTVIAAVHDKVLINAALGLDSWLVMRHGHGGDDSGVASSRLGCYFCNDVVAPENSTRNRTLDQQCTVTRPGLAPIASSMAVELLISLLHHPRKQRAPAPSVVRRSNNNTDTTYSPVVRNSNSDNDDGQEGDSSSSSSSSSSSPLGVIPHQIRGSIVTYTMMTPSVPAFDCCTGCSIPVLDAYRTNKHELVSRVCSCGGPAPPPPPSSSADNNNDDELLFGANYLEKLSGLAKFRLDAAAKLAEMEDDYDNWDIDNEDDDDDIS